MICPLVVKVTTPTPPPPLTFTAFLYLCDGDGGLLRLLLLYVGVIILQARYSGYGMAAYLGRVISDMGHLLPFVLLVHLGHVQLKVLVRHLGGRRGKQIK